MALFLVFQVVCLVVWGWTLRKLYANVDKAQDAQPNKKVFVLNAVLIVLFLVFAIGAAITYLIA